MAEKINFVVRFGRTMRENNGRHEYVGGCIDIADPNKDALGFIYWRKIVYFELGYTQVGRISFCLIGEGNEDGFRWIWDDTDVGAMLRARSRATVTIFFEALPLQESKVIHVSSDDSNDGRNPTQHRRNLRV